ncbi:MotA/TolQ/ExbB proton channel family protein [Sphingomonas sp.]|jgi:biopolymer transport protein ExbB|uniref:MotA/TolQ/ExbB proton channel family protein n=1 Tax=Sphingomonas sp. TaxID=28214 RepID=UPI002D7E9591|nr:MotA/TolQ/ExbB proton channel family protein [Sphingomonas sp.]HEU0044401.1 MotA/TolQ/ExbB proton channel family protein [Sphingomonas sp.]
MLTTILAAAPAGTQQYGLVQALEEGGPISWATFAILVLMLVVSLYILFTKLFEQQKIRNQAKRVQQSFWASNSLREGAAKLEKNSAYRQIVDDGLAAQDQHTKLTDPVEAHDWLHGSLARSEASINSQLNAGLAFLGTVGATAPFIGLFGTVVGIYRALIAIGASGQASIDKVAGPVGEALIMTALGLVVAVPAVLSYNWLQRRNKSIQEDLSSFSNDVLGFLASNGAVKPNYRNAGATATASSGGTAAAKAPARATSASTTMGATGANPTQS